MTPLPDLLDAYEPDDRLQVREKKRFSELLRAAGNAAFDRHHYLPGHITASCWIIDVGGDTCLLTHHRKLNRWLQLGGHCDGSPDVAATCLREAVEESGLSEFEFVHEGIYDLDIHEIPARKADPAHLHYDVRFLLKSSSMRTLTVSAESHDLAWVPINQLADFTTEESVLRLARKWQTIQATT